MPVWWRTNDPVSAFPPLPTISSVRVAEYDNCKLLLVDKKISTARDMIGILEGAIRGGYPLLIMAEDIEQVRYRDVLFGVS